MENKYFTRGNSSAVEDTYNVYPAYGSIFRVGEQFEPPIVISAAIISRPTDFA